VLRARGAVAISTSYNRRRGGAARASQTQDGHRGRPHLKAHRRALLPLDLVKDRLDLERFTWRRAGYLWAQPPRRPG